MILVILCIILAVYGVAYQRNKKFQAYNKEHYASAINWLNTKIKSNRRSPDLSGAETELSVTQSTDEDEKTKI